MSQLEEQGLLSSEALGQIFTSVSDILNSEWGQEQKDNRSKVRVACSFCTCRASLFKSISILLAKGANADQNDWSSVEIPQQHNPGSASDGQSCGWTHAELR